MNHWFSIISLILWRDIWPARDGAGWKNRMSFNLVVSLLPTGGILVILLASALFGFYLVMENQRVVNRLIEVRESPYMALFAEGFMNRRYQGRSYHQETGFGLDEWRQKKLTDLRLSQQTDLPADTLLFDNVFPFYRASLNIRRADGQHLEGWKGLVLTFEGEDRDSKLLNEIQKQAPEKNWQIPSNNDVEGIIVSEQLLQQIGYQAEKPKFIWVHTWSGKKDIPLRILTIAKELPYQVWYVMSVGQWARLDTNIYDETVDDGFDIIYPNPLNPDDYQAEQKLIKQHLPSVSSIERIKIDGQSAVDVLLEDEPSISWLDIVKFSEKHPQRQRQITVPLSDSIKDMTQYYNGAIFHINPTLLGSQDLSQQPGLLVNIQKILVGTTLSGTTEQPQTTTQQILRRLQEVLDERQITVRGELIHALQEAFKDQQNLAKMQKIFGWGILLLLLIISFFFAVILHSRLNRIGILRMLGISKIVFVTTYIFSTLLFIASAFLVAWLLFYVTGVDMSYLYSWNTAGLMGRVTLFAIIGVLLPISYFLNAMSPAEMLTYRV